MATSPTLLFLSRQLHSEFDSLLYFAVDNVLAHGGLGFFTSRSVKAFQSVPLVRSCGSCHESLVKFDNAWIELYRQEFTLLELAAYLGFYPYLLEVNILIKIKQDYPSQFRQFLRLINVCKAETTITVNLKFPSDKQHDKELDFLTAECVTELEESLASVR